MHQQLNMDVGQENNNTRGGSSIRVKFFENYLKFFLDSLSVRINHRESLQIIQHLQRSLK